MYFKDLVLHADNLEGQYDFYVKNLGFPLIEKWPSAFCIRAGITHVTFQQNTNQVKEARYHFAFGLKDERILTAREFLRKRVRMVSTPKYPDSIVHFPAWGSRSLYFYDADGNVVEFICREKKSNEFKEKYSISDVKSICEIGLPVADMGETYNKLFQCFQLQKCPGETEHFCPVGDHDGRLILVSLHYKHWYPTSVPVQGADFKAVIQNQRCIGEVAYQQGKLSLY